MHSADGPKIYEFEDFRLDAVHLLLFRGDQELPLTPKVVETLLAFVERPGEVVSKEDLMRTLWPESVVEESNLSQNLYVLRKALGRTSRGGPFIETLRRRGYRFSPEVGVRRAMKSPRMNATGIAVENPALHRAVARGSANAGGTPDNSSRVRPTRPRHRRPIPAVLVLVSLALTAIAAGAFYNRSRHPATVPSFGELTFTSLTNGREVNDVTISPDGGSIAYYEPDGDEFRLWIQPVGESARLELIPPSSSPPLAATFSSDGKHLYFVRFDEPSRSTLYRVSVVGGGPERMTENVAPAAVGPSPDGETVAFVRHLDATQSTIVLIRDGREETILTTQKGHYIPDGVAWSPDGGSIAFASLDLDATDLGHCSVMNFDVGSGATRKLSAEQWDTCGRMAWTNDGKGLLMIGTKFGDTLSTRRDQLYLISPETGASRRVTTDGNRHQVASLGVSRRDEIVVVPFNRSSQLWVMDAGAESSTARQVTSGASDGRSGIVELPDGRFGYTARTGDDIHIFTVNPDGSDLREISVEPQFLEELRGSPDGKHFYFSSFVGGEAILFRCRTDGSDLRQVVTDEAFSVDSSISPDGRWIAYTSARKDQSPIFNTLSYVAAEGGEPVRLTSFDSEAPHFSPDGRFISFVDPAGKIGAVTFPQGKLVALFDMMSGARTNTGSRWTPDGRALTYIAAKGKAANIWMQPLDGSPARALTNFTSGDMHNYTFSRDGTKLIIARGYPIKDAVLIRSLDQSGR